MYNRKTYCCWINWVIDDGSCSGDAEMGAERISDLSEGPLGLDTGLQCWWCWSDRTTVGYFGHAPDEGVEGIQRELLIMELKNMYYIKSSVSLRRLRKGR